MVWNIFIAVWIHLNNTTDTITMILNMEFSLVFIFNIDPCSHRLNQSITRCTLITKRCYHLFTVILREIEKVYNVTLTDQLKRKSTCNEKCSSSELYYSFLQTENDLYLVH